MRFGYIIAAAAAAGGIIAYKLARAFGSTTGKEEPPTSPHPATTASPQTGTPTAATSGRGVVIAGELYPMPATVDHSNQFAIGMPGTQPRTTPITKGVIHWSGGEGNNGGVYRTLVGRGLAVHYTIDRDGKIWQHADPAEVRATHVGGAFNDQSWGVEVVGRPGAIPELTYQATAQGEPTTATDFTPAQYRSLFALVEAHADALGIPRVVMGPPWGYHADSPSFRGVVGHLHVSRQKPDPGPRPLERLAAQPGWRQDS
jgi:hypothetical protein